MFQFVRLTSPLSRTVRNSRKEIKKDVSLRLPCLKVRVPESEEHVKREKEISKEGTRVGGKRSKRRGLPQFLR